MKLIDRVLAPRTQTRYTMDDYAAWVADQYGLYAGGLNQTYAPDTKTEQIADDFLGHTRMMFKSNGPVFALIAFRTALFSQARWCYRQVRNGRGGDLFSTPEMDVLNLDPDLAVTMVQDVDLAGNFFGVREGDLIRRLRPDWVQMIGDRPLNRYDVEIVGIAYFPDGNFNRPASNVFLPREVVHWKGLNRDPEAAWRGMSWLTPIIREVQADTAATKHKLKFFENGATPNLLVKVDKDVSLETFEKFKDKMEEGHAGVQNAYKTLYLGAGADATVIGANMQQLDFAVTQGKGESRLASAARVPAVLAGFSEGLQAATYSNFGQARRAAADSLLHPMWVSAAAAFANVIEPQPGAQLWYDSRDIPFLREDAMDDAAIKQQEAATIRTLIDAGYEPSSVVAAVNTGDWTLLQHTGLFSIQLQAPGSQRIPGGPADAAVDQPAE